MDRDYQPPVAPGDKLRAGLALQLVAASTGVPVERMTARARLEGSACRARWLAMYLAHVTFGWPLDRVSLAFGLNRSTATQACRWAEDERTRPRIDALLDWLEGCMLDVLAAPVCELNP